MSSPFLPNCLSSGKWNQPGEGLPVAAPPKLGLSAPCQHGRHAEAEAAIFDERSIICVSLSVEGRIARLFEFQGARNR